ncbi:MAG: hypothetical protein ACFB0B_17970 [Thermonemataceae bacterium]
MRKYIVLASFLLCGVYFYNCRTTAQTQKVTQSVASDTIKAIRFPNDDSELALLMREMYTDTEQIRQALLAGKLPPDFREKFAQLHTATPTDSSTKNPQYEAMGAAFLQHTQRMYAAKEDSTRLQAYGLMVQMCIACHQNQCPGPLKRIQKLTIR